MLSLTNISVSFQNRKKFRASYLTTSGKGLMQYVSNHSTFVLALICHISQDEERFEQEIQMERQRKRREAEEAKLALARLEQQRLEDMKREEKEQLEREKSERAIRGGIRGVRGTRASTRGMRGASASSRPGTRQVLSTLFQPLINGQIRLLQLPVEYRNDHPLHLPVQVLVALRASPDQCDMFPVNISALFYFIPSFYVIP